MPNLKSLTLALALAAVTGVCGTVPAAAAPTQQIPTIDAAKVKSMQAIGAKITIVDVRQPQEFNAGNIPGAKLMPLDKLPNTYTSLPKKGKLIVYCRSGHRSAQAVQFLLAHGYSNAVSMKGGYIAWSKK